ncbi:MAG: hypothetical protein IJV97_05305 [Alphaproteobacteria bacterium]|nr:hypothetical protein [Alphaproteobacteria bacterium]
MKKLYLFFCSLALIMIAFSPANAQRKNTTRHDREPVNMMQSAEKYEDLNCHKIKEQYKKCKHLKKEDKKEWKKELKKYKKKHKKYDD